MGYLNSSNFNLSRISNNLLNRMSHLNPLHWLLQIGRIITFYSWVVTGILVHTTQVSSVFNEVSTILVVLTICGVNMMLLTVAVITINEYEAKVLLFSFILDQIFVCSILLAFWWQYIKQFSKLCYFFSNFYELARLRLRSLGNRFVT